MVPFFYTQIKGEMIMYNSSDVINELNAIRLSTKKNTENVLSISYSNSKLGKLIPSINLLPQYSCRENAPCSSGCYGKKGRFNFKNVKQTLIRNTLLWYTNPQMYELQAIVAFNMAHFARWHSVGDIVSPEYFDMQIRVARACPNTKILCFTKQFEIVNSWLEQNGGMLPENFNVVFSTWGTWKPVNPFRLPETYVEFNEKKHDNANILNASIPSDAFECPAYCGDCASDTTSCWNLKNGQSVYFHEH